jgi:hypothetical protein
MKVVALIAFFVLAIAEEPLIKVNIDSTMTDKRDLYYARGSSACWGIPGLAPQPDGSINVVPDENNFACPCSDDTCDYYQKLLMPLYLDSKLDIFHRREELIGQVEFLGHGKNVSSKVQWTFKCEIIDAEATHKISCNEETSPDPSLYFKAYKVSLSDPSAAKTTPTKRVAQFLPGDMVMKAKDDCEYYRKVQDPHCGDVCLPAKMGVCPRSIIVSEGKLEAGKCAEKGYTVDRGEKDEEAGPCGTLKIEQWVKPLEISV